jgi:hypothetical protein
MDPETARRLQVRRKILAVLGTILGAFLLLTVTSPGLYVGFPPSICWARTWNRWVFDRNEGRYRELAALIRADAVSLKPGESAFYSDTSVGGTAAVRRVSRNYGGLEIEAYRYRNETAVRFVQRRLWDGASFSLVYWDPQPNPGCIWWPADWWDNEYIEWIDPQWWSTYSSRSDS